MGGSIGPSLKGAGTGVGQREKGFEEGVSVPVWDVDDVDVLESVELCRDFAKLLRRKGSGGRR